MSKPEIFIVSDILYHYTKVESARNENNEVFDEYIKNRIALGFRLFNLTDGQSKNVKLDSLVENLWKNENAVVNAKFYDRFFSNIEELREAAVHEVLGTSVADPTNSNKNINIEDFFEAVNGSSGSSYYYPREILHEDEQFTGEVETAWDSGGRYVLAYDDDGLYIYNANVNGKVEYMFNDMLKALKESDIIDGIHGVSYFSGEYRYYLGTSFIDIYNKEKLLKIKEQAKKLRSKIAYTMLLDKKSVFKYLSSGQILYNPDYELCNAMHGGEDVVGVTEPFQTLDGFHSIVAEEVYEVNKAAYIKATGFIHTIYDNVFNSVELNIIDASKNKLKYIGKNAFCNSRINIHKDESSLELNTPVHICQNAFLKASIIGDIGKIKVNVLELETGSLSQMKYCNPWNGNIDVLFYSTVGGVIRSYALTNTNFSRLEIGDNIIIEENAFAGCYIEKLILGSNCELKSGAFRNAQIGKVEFDGSIDKIIKLHDGVFNGAYVNSIKLSMSMMENSIELVHRNGKLAHPFNGCRSELDITVLGYIPSGMFGCDSGLKIESLTSKEPLVIDSCAFENTDISQIVGMLDNINNTYLSYALSKAIITSYSFTVSGGMKGSNIFDGAKLKVEGTSCSILNINPTNGVVGDGMFQNADIDFYRVRVTNLEKDMFNGAKLHGTYISVNNCECTYNIGDSCFENCEMSTECFCDLLEDTEFNIIGTRAFKNCRVSGDYNNYAHLYLTCNSIEDGAFEDFEIVLMGDRFEMTVRYTTHIGTKAFKGFRLIRIDNTLVSESMLMVHSEYYDEAGNDKLVIHNNTFNDMVGINVLYINGYICSNANEFANIEKNNLKNCAGLIHEIH